MYKQPTTQKDIVRKRHIETTMAPPRTHEDGHDPKREHERRQERETAARYVAGGVKDGVARRELGTRVSAEPTGGTV